MSARRVTFALAVAGVLLLLASALSAQNSHARIVRLSYLDGQVQVTRGAGQTPEKALLNMPMVEGMRLSVEQGGHAEVEFENDSTMRLIGPAQVTLQELTLGPDGRRNTLVGIEEGLIYFDLPRAKDNEFRVEFHGNTFAAKKNAQFRVDVSGDGQNLAVTKGEVWLQGEPKEVAVKKNQTISFQGSETQYALNKGVDALGADAWNHDREQDRQLLARSEQYHATNSYYGNNYGMYDLARYGNWYYGPGYGWLWRPYFYDASYAYDPFAWDPFGYGNWSYYPGFGWTFISGYPWGWAPYRYGSWLFVPGYGWSWRPGPPSYGWQAVPVVVDPPTGYRIPRPPNKGAAVMPGTVIAARPVTGTTVTGGVPRPGTVVTREVVPMHRVVPPGALNAGRIGKVRAIGVPGKMQGTTMVRPNPKGVEAGKPATVPNPKLPPQASPTAVEHTQPRMTPPSAQPRTTPPAPQPHVSPPPPPPQRMGPPPMREPSMPSAPPPMPHTSGAAKPH